jgi:hypothetical protein
MCGRSPDILSAAIEAMLTIAAVFCARKCGMACLQPRNALRR